MPDSSVAALTTAQTTVLPIPAAEGASRESSTKFTDVVRRIAGLEASSADTSPANSENGDNKHTPTELDPNQAETATLESRTARQRSLHPDGQVAHLRRKHIHSPESIGGPQPYPARDASESVLILGPEQRVDINGPDAKPRVPDAGITEQLAGDSQTRTAPDPKLVTPNAAPKSKPGELLPAENHNINNQQIDKAQTGALVHDQPRQTANSSLPTTQQVPAPQSAHMHSNNRTADYPLADTQRSSFAAPQSRDDVLQEPKLEPVPHVRQQQDATVDPRIGKVAANVRPETALTRSLDDRVPSMPNSTAALANGRAGLGANLETSQFPTEVLQQPSLPGPKASEAAATADQRQDLVQIRTSPAAIADAQPPNSAAQTRINSERVIPRSLDATGSQGDALPVKHNSTPASPAPTAPPTGGNVPVWNVGQIASAPLLGAEPLVDPSARDLPQMGMPMGSGPDGLSTAPASARYAQLRGDFIAPQPVQIGHVTRNQADGSIEIALQPEELGTIRLNFRSAEHGIMVTLSAERETTYDLIRRNAEFLAEELRRQGFESFEFDFDQSQDRWQGDGLALKDRQDEGGVAVTEHQAAHHPPSPMRQRAITDAGLDLRL